MGQGWRVRNTIVTDTMAMCILGILGHADPREQQLRRSDCLFRLVLFRWWTAGIAIFFEAKNVDFSDRPILG
jgi:hypothetical protein